MVQSKSWGDFLSTKQHNSPTPGGYNWFGLMHFNEVQISSRETKGEFGSIHFPILVVVKI
jgi:hypothetical protein